VPRAPALFDPEIKVGAVVLAHHKLKPQDVERIVPRLNGDTCYIGIEKTDGSRVESVIVPADGRHSETAESVLSVASGDPSEVLTKLLERPDLTAEQRAVIESAYRTLEHSGDSDGKHDILSFLDIPITTDFKCPLVDYLEAGVLAKGVLTGVTGASGDGKSTLITAIGKRVAAGGIPVLILDRDNPLPAINKRFAELEIEQGPFFRIWGRWCPQEPPPLDSEFLLSFVVNSEPKPLIILDSFGAFFRGEENSATQVRAFLEPAKRLVDLGASVVVLHNTGKAESSRDFRGSQAFEDAIDDAFHVSNCGKKGLLDKLTLRSFKYRLGFTGEVVYNYANGAIQRANGFSDATSPDARQSDRDLTALLADHPGIGKRAFVDAAKPLGVSNHKARGFLDAGVKAGCIRCDVTGPKHAYFLIGDVK
jgi:AAA domain